MAVDIAFFRATQQKIDSAFFYTVSSNFYRKKIIEKSYLKTGLLKSKIKNLKLGNTHLKPYIST